MFARRRELLEREAERIGALAVRGDVTNPADLKRLVDRTLEAFGGIDILVNNSGGPPRTPGGRPDRRADRGGRRAAAALGRPPDRPLPAAPRAQRPRPRDQHRVELGPRADRQPRALERRPPGRDRLGQDAGPRGRPEEDHGQLDRARAASRPSGSPRCTPASPGPKTSQQIPLRRFGQPREVARRRLLPRLRRRELRHRHRDPRRRRPDARPALTELAVDPIARCEVALAGSPGSPGSLLLGRRGVLVLWSRPRTVHFSSSTRPTRSRRSSACQGASSRARDKGAIYFVDVSVRKARLLERLLPWVRADGSDARRPRRRISADARAAARASSEMTDSQKIAAVVALRHARATSVSARSAGVTVLVVQQGRPAAKVLQPDDVIVAVERQAGRRRCSHCGRCSPHKSPGDVGADPLPARRQGPNGDDQDDRRPERPRSGRSSASSATGRPRRSSCRSRSRSTPGASAGPSAGLAFALDILQELGRERDPRAQGRRDRRARARRRPSLPIGGVKQKTIGARRAGVDVFLVPAGENAREARRYADGLRIIPVKNFQQALRALATLAPKA